MYSVALMAFLALFAGTSALQAAEKGKCVGSDKLGLEVRQQNEPFCNAYDDNENECLKNKSKCEWKKAAKFCIASNPDREEHMKSCSQIFSEDECTKKYECRWDYMPKGCTAKDQDNKQDVNECENYDSNESSCKSSFKCVWGSI